MTSGCCLAWTPSFALALAITVPSETAVSGTVPDSVPIMVARSDGGGAPPQAVVKTVWDGVYTTAQADRGRQIYQRSCSLCHGTDLSGGDDDAPALIGPVLFANWRDKTLERIVGRVADTMPKDTPGSMSPSAYVDVIAFLLEANEVPSGRIELPPVTEALKGIRFTEEARP